MDRARLSVSSGIVLAIVGGFMAMVSCEQAGKEAVVRIGYLDMISGVPVAIAQEKGFFAGQGVAAQTKVFSSSNEIVDALLAGEIDCFSGASIVPVLAAETKERRRLKIFAVSQITADAPFDALLVRKDTAINSLSELAGKRIAVYPGSTAAGLLEKFLKDKGVDVSAVQFVPSAPAQHLEMLREGKVDAVHAYEPTIALAMTGGGFRQLYGSVFAELVSPCPVSVSVVSADFARRNAWAAAKTIAALEQAMVFIRENDAQGREILARQMKLSKEAAERCCFLYMAGHGQIDADNMQRFADMLHDIGQVSSQVDVGAMIYRR